MSGPPMADQFVTSPVSTRDRSTVEISGVGLSGATMATSASIASEWLERPGSALKASFRSAAPDVTAAVAASGAIGWKLTSARSFRVSGSRIRAARASFGSAS